LEGGAQRLLFSAKKVYNIKLWVGNDNTGMFA
jgi:hypothetical protein